MNDSNQGQVDGGTANVIYILYLVGIVVGITSIVGLIMAYMNKNEAPDWVASHYRLQIRTFWISILYAVVCMLTTLIYIGFVLFLVLLAWWIVRCIKGMNYLGKSEPYPNPATWWW